jgi:HEAT repeat protein
MDEPRLPDDPGPSPVCRAFLLKFGRTPDPLQRRRILAACVKIGRPWAEELLWESLADPNEGLRDLVTRELCRREGLRLEPALRRLRLPPWYARSAVLGVIGRRRMREAVPEIGRMIGDANADVRRASAEALGELGGEEAIRLLVRLKKDANPYVRAAAEEAIGKASGLRFS